MYDQKPVHNIGKSDKCSAFKSSGCNRNFWESIETFQAVLDLDEIQLDKPKFRTRFIGILGIVLK